MDYCSGRNRRNQIHSTQWKWDKNTKIGFCSTLTPLKFRFIPDSFLSRSENRLHASSSNNCSARPRRLRTINKPQNESTREVALLTRHPANQRHGHGHVHAHGPSRSSHADRRGRWWRSSSDVTTANRPECRNPRVKTRTIKVCGINARRSEAAAAGWRDPQSTAVTSQRAQLGLRPVRPRARSNESAGMA